MSRYSHLRLVRRKPLTCIIGAKCAEGVAMAADTRILREYEVSNENKVSSLWDRVAVAGSGTTSLFDMLVEELRQKNTLPSAKSSLDAVRIVEDMMAELQTRYRPRIGGNDYQIDALVAGLEGFDKGEPYLRFVDGRGFSEKVNTFAIIGHGKDCATPLFKLLYDPQLNMRELAVLESFIISLIVSLDVDQSVGFSGIGPQIIALRDDSKVEPINPYDPDFRYAMDLTKKDLYRPTLAYHLVKPIWGKIPQAYETVTSLRNFVE